MRIGHKHLIGAMFVGVMVIASACNGDSTNPLFGGGDQDTATTEAVDTTGAADPGGTAEGESDSDASADTGPDTSSGSAAAGDAARPLPIREGLGTFDSYVWQMSMTTTGPTPDERMQTAIQWSYSAADDARHLSTTSTVSGPDYEQPETTTEEVYTVGNRSCQYDGYEWYSEEITAQQREALDAAQSLMDIAIVPSDPVEVGEETIAGIPAIHYTFAVPGLGQDSGAVVTDNVVDYWIATDSRVLLKMLAVVETRNGPETDPAAEVFRIETAVELMSADQPLSIALPAECPPPETDDDVTDTTETTEAPAEETTTSTTAGSTLQLGSEINVRRSGDLVGTMREIPSCFALEQASGTTIGAALTGTVGDGAYSVSAVVSGIIDPGVYPDGEFTLGHLENGQLVESTGFGDVTIDFPGPDVVRMDFDVNLNGEGGRARLVGYLACSIAE